MQQLQPQQQMVDFNPPAKSNVLKALSSDDTSSDVSSGTDSGLSATDADGDETSGIDTSSMSQSMMSSQHLKGPHPPMHMAAAGAPGGGHY